MYASPQKGAREREKQSSLTPLTLSQLEKEGIIKRFEYTFRTGMESLKR